MAERLSRRSGHSSYHLSHCPTKALLFLSMSTVYGTCRLQLCLGTAQTWRLHSPTYGSACPPPSAPRTSTYLSWESTWCLPPLLHGGCHKWRLPQMLRSLTPLILS